MYSAQCRTSNSKRSSNKIQLFIFLFKISWIRLSDYRILTHGLVTFTADERFSVLHTPGGSEWSLQISGVQARDQGEYQCQFSTPTSLAKSKTIQLTVSQPKAFILGTREKHVNLGDSLKITCQLRDTLAQPEFVFWYHNNTMINFSPGISVAVDLIGPNKDELWVSPPNTSISTLRISSIRQEHSGKFTCAPPHSTTDSVRLFVSTGVIKLKVSRPL